ncbi:MAG: Rpn family recombination-promoting nuclease/putative transposase [Byssovorax sp.]
MPKPRTSSVPEELSQPHDALFRWTFSQREHAAGLLRAALPKALASVVDWTSLRVEKGTFVDQALRSRHSDLVLSARVGDEPVYFHAILEHQRDVEKLMIFRMGLYMMRLWEQLVRDRPALTTLPPIVPILIHHGDAGWTAPTAFQEIVGPAGAARTALLPHIPHFELRLVDLGAGRAGELVEHALTALGQVALWCLSVADDDARLEREMTRIGAALDAVLKAPDGLAALEVLLRYLVATHGSVGAKKVVKLLENASGPPAHEAIMTIFEEIELKGERRGERRGRVEGRAQGRAQTLVEILTVRFGSVPAETSATIMAASEAMLTRWTGRVLTAPTLDAVIAEAPARSSSARTVAARKRARPA